MTLGFRAGIEVAANEGIIADDPILIQETNNTVIWLRPHPIIVKVGTHADSAELFAREHDVAVALDTLGAPVAPPLPGIGPRTHPGTGFAVSFWQRFDHDVHARPPGTEVAASLLRVHEALTLADVPLPSFQVGLRRARSALYDDHRVAAITDVDRAFLRGAFDGLVAALGQRQLTERALHGEPHDGNLLVTPTGLRWIDFEGACRGPLEWDLAFLTDDARAAFSGVDRDLLVLLETLNSARVATWCWVRARFPGMLWHAEHHLAIVRARLPVRD